MMSMTDYTDIHNCINFLLTVAQHEVFQSFSDQLAELEITPGQYGVLNCLWKQGETTPTEIAQALCLENSTISGVLDRMQKKGLVDRLMDRNDRRSVRVVATKAGKALEKPVLDIVVGMNQEVFGAMDEQETEVLVKCLRRLGRID